MSQQVLYKVIYRPQTTGKLIREPVSANAYICSICDKEFDKEVLVHQHLREHNIPIACDETDSGLKEETKPAEVGPQSKKSSPDISPKPRFVPIAPKPCHHHAIHQAAVNPAVGAAPIESTSSGTTGVEHAVRAAPNQTSVSSAINLPVPSTLTSTPSASNNSRNSPTTSAPAVSSVPPPMLLPNQKVITFSGAPTSPVKIYHLAVSSAGNSTFPTPATVQVVNTSTAPLQASWTDQKVITIPISQTPTRPQLYQVVLENTAKLSSHTPDKAVVESPGANEFVHPAGCSSSSTLSHSALHGEAATAGSGVVPVFNQAAVTTTDGTVTPAPAHTVVDSASTASSSTMSRQAQPLTLNTSILESAMTQEKHPSKAPTEEAIAQPAEGSARDGQQKTAMKTASSQATENTTVETTLQEAPITMKVTTLSQNAPKSTVATFSQAASTTSVEAPLSQEPHNKTMETALPQDTQNATVKTTLSQEVQNSTIEAATEQEAENTSEHFHESGQLGQVESNMPTQNDKFTWIPVAGTSCEVERFGKPMKREILLLYEDVNMKSHDEAEPLTSKDEKSFQGVPISQQRDGANFAVRGEQSERLFLGKDLLKNENVDHSSYDIESIAKTRDVEWQIGKDTNDEKSSGSSANRCDAAIQKMAPSVLVNTIPPSQGNTEKVEANRDRLSTSSTDTCDSADQITSPGRVSPELFANGLSWKTDFAQKQSPMAEPKVNLSRDAIPKQDTENMATGELSVPPASDTDSVRSSQMSSPKVVHQEGSNSSGHEFVKFSPLVPRKASYPPVTNSSLVQRNNSVMNDVRKEDEKSLASPGTTVIASLLSMKPGPPYLPRADSELSAVNSVTKVETASRVKTRESVCAARAGSPLENKTVMSAANQRQSQPHLTATQALLDFVKRRAQMLPPSGETHSSVPNMPDIQQSMMARTPPSSVSVEKCPVDGAGAAAMFPASQTERGEDTNNQPVKQETTTPTCPPDLVMESVPNAVQKTEPSSTVMPKLFPSLDTRNTAQVAENVVGRTAPLTPSSQLKSLPTSINATPQSPITPSSTHVHVMPQQSVSTETTSTETASGSTTSVMPLKGITSGLAEGVNDELKVSMRGNDIHPKHEIVPVCEAKESSGHDINLSEPESKASDTTSKYLHQGIVITPQTVKQEKNVWDNMTTEGSINSLESLLVGGDLTTQTQSTISTVLVTQAPPTTMAVPVTPPASVGTAAMPSLCPTTFKSEESQKSRTSAANSNPSTLILTTSPTSTAAGDDSASKPQTPSRTKLPGGTIISAHKSKSNANCVMVFVKVPIGGREGKHRQYREIKLQIPNALLKQSNIVTIITPLILPLLQTAEKIVKEKIEPSPAPEVESFQKSIFTASLLNQQPEETTPKSDLNLTANRDVVFKSDNSGQMLWDMLKNRNESRDHHAAVHEPVGESTPWASTKQPAVSVSAEEDGREAVPCLKEEIDAKEMTAPPSMRASEEVTCNSQLLLSPKEEGDTSTFLAFCPVCDWGFASREKYKKHMKTHQKRFQCKHCPFTTDGVCQISSHMKCHRETEETETSGKNTTETVGSTQAIEREPVGVGARGGEGQDKKVRRKYRRHRKKGFQCKWCPFSADRLSRITSHMQRYHIAENGGVSGAVERTANRRDVQAIESADGGGASKGRRDPGGKRKYKPRSRRVAKRTDSIFRKRRIVKIPVKRCKEPLFVCSVCNKDYCYESSFLRHCKSCTPDSVPFMCPKCPKAFPSRSLLGHHVKDHGLTMCADGRTFPTSESSDIHKMIQARDGGSDKQSGGKSLSEVHRKEGETVLSSSNQEKKPENDRVCGSDGDTVTEMNSIYGDVGGKTADAAHDTKRMVDDNASRSGMKEKSEVVSDSGDNIIKTTGRSCDNAEVAKLTTTGDGHDQSVKEDTSGAEWKSGEQKLYGGKIEEVKKFANVDDDGITIPKHSIVAHGRPSEDAELKGLTQVSSAMTLGVAVCTNKNEVEINSQDNKKDVNASTVFQTEFKFNCKFCNFKTNMANQMRLHKTTTHRQCKLCSLSVIDSKTFRMHVKSSHGKRPFNCELCRQNFRVRHRLRCHYRTHNRLLYDCDYCPYFSCDATKMQQHVEEYHDTEERLHNCSQCQMAFATVPQLLRHVKLRHKSVEEGTGFDSERKEATLDGKIKCRNCKFQATDKEEMMKHEKAHCSQLLVVIQSKDIKKYRCYQCEYQSDVVTGLMKHKQYHVTKGRNSLFQCSNCHKNCFGLDHYHKHMAEYHNSVIRCEFCPHEASSVESIIMHQEEVHCGGAQSQDGDHAASLPKKRNMPSSTIQLSDKLSVDISASKYQFVGQSSTVTSSEKKACESVTKPARKRRINCPWLKTGKRKKRRRLKSQCSLGGIDQLTEGLSEEVSVPVGRAPVIGRSIRLAGIDEEKEQKSLTAVSYSEETESGIETTETESEGPRRGVARSDALKESRKRRAKRHCPWVSGRRRKNRKGGRGRRKSQNLEPQISSSDGASLQTGSQVGQECAPNQDARLKSLNERPVNISETSMDGVQLSAHVLRSSGSAETTNNEVLQSFTFSNSVTAVVDGVVYQGSDVVSSVETETSIASSSEQTSQNSDRSGASGRRRNKRSCPWLSSGKRRRKKTKQHSQVLTVESTELLQPRWLKEQPSSVKKRSSGKGWKTDHKKPYICRFCSRGFDIAEEYQRHHFRHLQPWNEK